MALGVVAIIGRPNVGKSTLFNALAGRRISIEEPTAGVTRDRISAIVQIGGRYVELIDTGGIGVVDSDALEADIERQIETAMHKADVLVFVLDIHDGLVPLDLMVAEKVRLLNKPVIAVANKSDQKHQEVGAADFNRLGFDEIIPVSGRSSRGMDELREKILSVLPASADDEEAPADPEIKIAVVGKRNVGKSTLINALAKEERVIVSEIPGTTRDTIDIRIERDGRVFLVIDTAGIRKKQKVSSAIEMFSHKRAEAAVRRSDVAVMMLDVTEEIGEVDKKLAAFIASEKKPCVIAVNKWDLAKGKIVTGEFEEYLTKKLPVLAFAPVVVLTAKDGKNVSDLLDVCRGIYRQAGRRVGTGKLNRAIDDLRKTLPKTRDIPKIYYATQVAVHPPTIVIFVHEASYIEDRHMRTIENMFRAHLDFPEVPIRVVLKRRDSRETKKGRKS
jgi:GTP-binding protein